MTRPNSNPYKMTQKPSGNANMPTTAPKNPNAPAGSKTGSGGGGGSSTAKTPKPPVGSQLKMQGQAAQARQAARQATRMIARSSSTKAGTKAVTKVAAAGASAAYIKQVSKGSPKVAKRLTATLTKLDSLTDKDSGKTTAAQRRKAAIKASAQVPTPQKKKKH